MNVRKALGPVLALLLLIGVAAATDHSIREYRQAQARINIRILTGPENEPFLEDPQLAKVLADHGMTLTIRKAGSRQIAARPDLKTFDAAFPDSEHDAVRISQDTGVKRIFTAFYTPMVVASWKRLIPVLEQNGFVYRKNGSYYIIDMAKLINQMERGERWKDLPGNTAYAVGKSILLTSSDIFKSNSAAMYLSLASYLANGSNVVDTDAAVDKISPGMISLFSRQGYQEASSAATFEDYIVMGIGKSPLVMIYEQQFLEYVLAHSSPNPDMVLLYPEPTVLAKHTIVALSDNGARFARELTSDPNVTNIAHHYGFHTQDNSELFAALEAKKFPIPHTIVNVIDPPTYDILERLINQVDAGLKQ